MLVPDGGFFSSAMPLRPAQGVNAVDWSPLYKFVLTGSLDRRVIMWNPFSQKPLAVLHGHNAAVSSVVVNDRDNQIISLSTDHVIKVGPRMYWMLHPAGSRIGRQSVNAARPTCRLRLGVQRSLLTLALVIRLSY